MDVTLPSGLVIKGVPDGTSKDAIKQKAIASGLATEADFGAPTPVDTSNPYADYSPLDEMSGTEKFLAGAGKGFTDIGRGLGQLFGIESEPQDAAIDDALMSTGAGLAGNIASQIGTAAGGGTALRGAGALGSALGAGRAGQALTTAGTALSAPRTLTGAMGGGAALAGAQPAEDALTRLRNMSFGALGGGVGHGIASGIGRVISPKAIDLSEADKAMAASLESKGVQLDALDLTDSKPLNVLESVFENLPFTASKAGERASNRIDAFTRATLRSIGEDADQITPDLLSNASVRIGNTFDTLIEDAPISADAKFFDDLKSLMGQASKLPKSMQPKGTKGPIDDLMTMEQALKAGQDPQITPETYQLMRSALSKRAKGMAMNNPQGAAEIGRIQSALDDLVERNLGGEKLAAWKDARRQWRNLKIIEKAAGGTQTALQSGKIRPQDLTAAVKTVGKENVARKGSELGDLAQAGMKFANLTPDSGTAQRAMMQGLITGGLGMGAYGAGADPLLVAAGIGGPMALQRALYSPAARSYLANTATESVPLLGQAGRTTLTRGGVPLLGLNND